MNLITLEEVREASVPLEIPIRGIYFLLAEGEVVYVGQSTHCRARIQQHTKEKVFDAYSIFECLPDANLNEIEAAHIAHYLPRDNTRMPAETGLIGSTQLFRFEKIGKIRMRRWIKLGLVTPVYMGGGVFYRRAEIDAALASDQA